jgi:predicted CXXCH cytochrome family protein
MRKVKNILLLVLLSIALMTGTAYAISGQCAGCHTMHYSQNGTLLPSWGTAGPYNNLLLDSCIGCHSGPAGQPTSGNAPIVLRDSGVPAGQGIGNTLAGGDFYWVANGSDALGHNVDILPVGPDAAIFANIGNNPPGWNGDTTTYNIDDFGGVVANNEAAWSTQLTCAGTWGCHGNHDITDNDAGITGTHHNNTGGTSTRASSPTTIGGSYRFCAGISGLEEGTWEWSADASVHNEYFGDTTSDTGAAPNKETISFFCALCHGNYHEAAQIGASATPWLRHPTDLVLMSGSRGTSEYSAYNNAGGPPNALYSNIAPVARGGIPVPAASTNTVVTTAADNTGAIVMCLSCHRAHGSDQPDILRWDYSAIIAGGAGGNIGCFICHTTKD